MLDSVRLAMCVLCQWAVETAESGVCTATGSLWNMWSNRFATSFAVVLLILQNKTHATLEKGQLGLAAGRWLVRAQEIRIQGQRSHQDRRDLDHD